MSSFVFGKGIALEWAPTINGKPVAAHSLVSARLYSDKPTTGQIENTESGHIEEVLSWTALSDSHGYRIDFAAVTDNDPHSLDPYETYFVIINFLFAAAGEEKFDKEVLYIFRPDSVISKISVNAERIAEREKKIGEIRSDTEIEKHIEAAKRRVWRHLKGLGIEQRTVFNLEELNDAVEEATLASLCIDLSGEGNQFWFRKAEYYDKRFDEIMKATKPNVDASGGDEPDLDTSETNAGVVYLIR